MTSFTQTFGGQLINPTYVSYAAYSITADLTLQWPFQADDNANVLAYQNDITATAGLSVTFPDATQVSVGQGALVFNAGSNTFTVKGNTGATLGTVASGDAWYFYLTDNSTAAGVWQSFQFGAGTSAASAASLAGLGLQAVASKLNQNLPTTSLGANYSPTVNDSTSVFRNTGGAVVYTPASAGTLGQGWFVYVINSGSGTITWTPAGGQTVDGSATKVLNPTESAIFFSDGANFWTLGFGRSIVTTVSAIGISLAGSGTTTLNSAQLTAQIQDFTGALTGDAIVEYGTGAGYWFVYNNTTGAYTVTARVNGGDAGSVLTQGNFSIIRSNGTNMKVAFTATSGTVTSVATTAGQLVGGTITSAGTLGLATTAVAAGSYGSASKLSSFTVDGFGRLTAAADTNILITNVQAFSSADLASVLTDETGTGVAVFGTAPSISNPTITGGGSWAGSPTLTSPTLTTPTLTSPTINSGNLGNASVATTQAQASNDTKLATDAYVDRVAVQQIERTDVNTYVTHAGLTPVDNTNPQFSEGSSYGLSVTITPKSGTSRLRVRAFATVGTTSGVACVLTGHIHRDSATDSIVATGLIVGDGPLGLDIDCDVSSGSTTSTTFELIMGTNDGRGIYLNGFGGVQIYGGVCNSFIEVTEYGI
jgi:hypothetical protein